MKRLVLVFGVLGLVGCFLPFVPGASWFDLRHIDPGWTVWLVMAAYAGSAVVGFERRERSLVGAAIATACFGFIVYKFGFDIFKLVVHAAIGGKMMAVAALGGLGSSLAALAGAKK